MVVLIAELSFESHHSSSHRTTRPRDKGVTRHLQDYLGISGANGGLPLIYCSDWGGGCHRNIMPANPPFPMLGVGPFMS